MPFQLCDSVTPHIRPPFFECHVCSCSPHYANRCVLLEGQERYPQECRTMAWPRCGPPGQSCGLPRLMPIDYNQAEETWRVSSALELDDSMQ